MQHDQDPDSISFFAPKLFVFTAPISALRTVTSANVLGIANGRGRGTGVGVVEEHVEVRDVLASTDKFVQEIVRVGSFVLPGSAVKSSVNAPSASSFVSLEGILVERRREARSHVVRPPGRSPVDQMDQADTEVILPGDGHNFRSFKPRTVPELECYSQRRRCFGFGFFRRCLAVHTPDELSELSQPGQGCFVALEARRELQQ